MGVNALFQQKLQQIELFVDDSNVESRASLFRLRINVDIGLNQLLGHRKVVESAGEQQRRPAVVSLHFTVHLEFVHEDRQDFDCVEHDDLVDLLPGPPLVQVELLGQQSLERGLVQLHLQQTFDHARVDVGQVELAVDVIFDNLTFTEAPLLVTEVYKHGGEILELDQEFRVWVPFDDIHDLILAHELFYHLEDEFLVVGYFEFLPHIFRFVFQKIQFLQMVHLFVVDLALVVFT